MDTCRFTEKRLAQLVMLLVRSVLVPRRLTVQSVLLKRHCLMGFASSAVTVLTISTLLVLSAEKSVVRVK